MGARTFIVLGSSSFSGASFCDYLAEQGLDVVATSRSPEPHPALLPYKWASRPGRVRFQRIDINHDLDALRALILRERASHVVNFAAQSMVAQSWDRPEDWMTTNVVAAVRFQNMLRSIDVLDRYVHVTTPEVYGSTTGWTREGAPFNPSTPYAVSRAAADMALKVYVETFGLPAVSTRAANIYGPGQQLYRIVPRAILAGLGLAKLRLDGGGGSMRVFVHARDVADATLRVALDGAVGETYHISGWEPVSIRALVETILGKLGRDFDDCVEFGPDRPGKDQAYLLDSSKIRKALGWRDRISLSEGLDECIAWAERFRGELASLPQSYVHKP